MGKIDYVDMKVIEDVLQMNSGYVLDFNNASFKKFIYDNLAINIDDEYYKDYGASKAKRLRCFFDKSTEKQIGNLLLHFLRYRKEVMKLPCDEDFIKCCNIANRLSGKIVKNTATSQDKKVQSVNFPKLINDYYVMLKIKDNQERGYALEKYINFLFKEYGLNPRSSFRLKNEQIDGSFTINGDNYLLEVKFTNKIDYNSLILFQTKLEERAYAKGLFITYSLVKEEDIEHLKIGRNVRFVIMTVDEIWEIINNKFDLKNIIEKKQRLLDEKILPFVSIREL